MTDNLEYFPTELKNLDRWVLWSSKLRDNKPTKVPFSTNGQMASVVDIKSWTTFEQAYNSYDEDPLTYSGVGCVICTPFVGIDLDKCRDPKTGIVELWAKEALAELNSYAELSPSGKGFHIWVKGYLKNSVRRGNIEVYVKERYFTVTGLHVAGTPTVINQVDLQSFCDKYITNSTSSVPKDNSKSVQEFKVAFDIWTKLGRNASDEEVLLEFCKKAEYREKWEKNKGYISRTIQAAKQKAFQIPPSNASELSLVSFSNIEAKAMEWLWENRIPKGKLVMFFGNPDCGKTTVLCDLIAHYTTGTKYPDGALAAETGEVLFLGAEDDPADTLKPRLLAAGANTAMVHYVLGVRAMEQSKRVERTVALDTDLAAIERALSQNPKIGLVAIDPITSYFGNSDLNKEQALRKILGPIKELAESKQVTFVCLGHFNKRSDVNVLHKAGGAVAMTGVSRAVWLFMKNPELEGQFLMLLGKGNLTKNRSGLKYSIIEKFVPTGTAPIIDWQGEETMDAESISDTLKDPKERASAKAEKFLKDFVSAGLPAPSDDLANLAKKLGIGRTTLFNMKRDNFGNIRAEKRGLAWWWVPTVSGKTEGENEMSMYA